MNPDRPESLLDTDLFRSKETSWLSFNARVLQEAADPTVPVIERVRFLGIYSSNLDEFFRVRVATLKRLIRLGKHYRKLRVPDPRRNLREVNRLVTEQTAAFNETYAKVLEELAEKRVRVVKETEIPPELEGFIDDFFEREVKPRIMPIMVKTNSLLVGLKDHPMYLAVRLSKRKGKGRPAHALLEIPTSRLPRFTVLPKIDGTDRVIYLDDIIRWGLPKLFASLPYDTFESFAIKFTRDAEMEFDDDITESIYEKVAEGLREREHGNPVRLNYDADIPAPMLRLLCDKLRLTGEDTLFPGARYHNRKDLMGFPTLGRTELVRTKLRPSQHPSVRRLESASRGVGTSRSLFTLIRRKDLLLHLPYQSFNLFLDLLREASIDPRVQRIYFTQYRLADHSCVANALINAVKNGKEVTVLVEPRARFDEGRNITYANAFQESGIKVLLGVPGLKVHAKLCLITRAEGAQVRLYSCVGSGNFNESTAKLYTDHLLLTANREIGEDVIRAFRFFQNSFRQPNLKHLVAAPHSLRRSLRSWVEQEIENAAKGIPAEIFLKINNLSDLETAALLYRASQAGVRVRLIVRGMFSVVPGVPGTSDHIEAIGIVDALLEHSRIFVFANGGSPRTFISSADFLPRNFDSRFEVVCPILDPDLQRELHEYLELQWRDNVKARILDADLRNAFRKRKKKQPAVRSQMAIADFVASLGRS